MRVAIITENFLPKLDGVTRTLARLLEHLQTTGHQALLLGPDAGMEQYAGAEVIGTGGIPLFFYPELKFNFFRPLFFRAAGPGIMEECRKIGGCPTGSAVATTAGRLDAAYIFHAVGPIYGYHADPAHLLTSAYQSCLELAEKYHVKSIAFPSLSTGAYGYPIDEAAPIALKTVLDHIQQPTELQQVFFVLFSNQIYQAYEQALAQLLT